MDAFLRFLIALMSIGLSLATYIIDDTNATIQYSPPGKWLKDTNFAYYKGTVTWNFCITLDNCTMTIPFTGSGITLYMVQFYACNFSVSIDGSAPMSFSLPKSDPLGNVNVTAYDKQALQSGGHILDLMLLDDTDTAGVVAAVYSEFWFDYAIVNETNAFPTPATTSRTVLPPTHTCASGRSSVTAAAVGGTLGGIAVIVASILIFVCILKASRSRPRPGEFDSEHKIDTSNDYRVEKPATSLTTWQPAQAAASFEQPDLTITSTPRDIAQYSTAATSSALASLASTSTEEDAALLLRLCNSGLSPGDITRLISIMNGRKESTVEDVKILQRLDTRNIPASTVTEEDAALLLRLSSLGLSPGDITSLISIMNGRKESTVEDMKILQRLYALNVPADDLNLVITAMQRRGQNREVVYHSSHNGADIAQFPVPPPLPEL